MRSTGEVRDPDVVDRRPDERDLGGHVGCGGGEERPGDEDSIDGVGERVAELGQEGGGVGGEAQLGPGRAAGGEGPEHGVVAIGGVATVAHEDPQVHGAIFACAEPTIRPRTA